jgi:hypothetical protein
MKIDYQKTVGMMVLSALSSGSKDNRADLIVQLGRGIADLVGAMKRQEDINAMLEVVFDCIRLNAAIAHQQFEKAAAGLEAAEAPTPVPDPKDEFISAEEFLDKRFKPEKFNA